MKHLKLIFTLIISVLLLVSCQKEEPPVPVREITFAGGDNAYTIIRSDKCSDILRKASGDLFSAIRKSGDERITVGTDRLKEGETAPLYEILFGNVNRTESANCEAHLPFDGFLIEVSGEKLVILASSDDYYKNAVEYITDNLLKDGKLVLAENYSFIQAMNEGNFPAENVLLGDVKLSDYSIYAENEEIAKNVQRAIGLQSGCRLPIISEKNDSPTIILGESPKESPKRIAYYSYRIESDGKNIYLTGYDDYALLQAAKNLPLLAANSENRTLSLSENIFEYKLPDRKEYIDNPSLLYMRWEFDRETPEWMLDFEAKKENIFSGNGTDKLYASAHRAEWKFYPENSIEAIISAYYMGAAIVELDFCATKDGVLILMHDDTLTRMTNCKDYLGKSGFPGTAKVSDWTYDQIKHLNLKEGGGGNGTTITPFKIATLEEALKVCKDRLFIVPDKAQNWQYVKNSDIMQDSKPIYLTDVMKKTGNFDSIIISYGKSSENYLTAKEACELQKLMKAETGIAPMICVRATPTSAGNYYRQLQNDAEPGTYTLQINGDYKESTKYSSAYSACNGKMPFLAWTISSLTGDNDFKATWSDMYQKGVRIIMTNNLFALTEYCASKGGN